jgi:hypothetical protein
MIINHHENFINAAPRMKTGEKTFGKIDFLASFHRQASANGMVD